MKKSTEWLAFTRPHAVSAAVWTMTTTFKLNKQKTRSISRRKKKPKQTCSSWNPIQQQHEKKIDPRLSPIVEERESRRKKKVKTKSRFNAQQQNSFLSSRRNHMVLDGWLDASMRAPAFFFSLQKSNFLFRTNKHFARTVFFSMAASAVATSKCVHCCVFHEHIFLYDDDDEGEKKTKKDHFLSSRLIIEVFVRRFIDGCIVRSARKRNWRNRRRKKENGIECVTFDPGSCQTLVPSSMCCVLRYFRCS